MQPYNVQPREQKTVAVVGLGKIGLPLAAQYARHGYRVIGCDINEQVVQSINAGKTHVTEEVELEREIPRFVRKGLLSATQNTSEAVRQADVVVVIVPVFVNAAHQVDFTAVDSATEAIGQGLTAGTVVIYETTLPVGTTAQRLRTILERTSHLSAERDFYLAYSPERVSSGRIFQDLRTYPKVIGGIDERSTEKARAFYFSVLDAEILTMASTEDAEFVKLIETTYRDVNIALANEYARYADQRGLNVMAAIAAANSQPYSHIHTPGVGVGGHCIPVYPYFLFANPTDQVEEGQEPLFSLPRRARLLNDSMADYTVQRIEELFGPLQQQAVLMLGVAYRGDVRETAFSSAWLLQEALVRRGATVYVDDPLFSEQELQELGYTPLPADADSKIRVILLQCAHQVYQEFDWQRFRNCELVCDGRQALKRAQIEELGMMYITIGDGGMARQRTIQLANK